MRIAIVSSGDQQFAPEGEVDAVPVRIGVGEPGDAEALATLMEEAERELEAAAAEGVVIATAGPPALAAAVGAAKLQLPAVRLRAAGEESNGADTALAERIAAPTDPADAIAVLRRLISGSDDGT